MKMAASGRLAANCENRSSLAVSSCRCSVMSLSCNQEKLSAE